MKIPPSITVRLNTRYITEIDVHGKTPNDFRDIWDNARVFIDRAIRKGNAISLNDTDYLFLEERFWDIEWFEDFCMNLYFTFKPGFTAKLIRRLNSVAPDETDYFHEVLQQHLAPYKDAIGHPTDPYLHFIGKKIQSLNKAGVLSEVMDLDKDNRQKLLNALQQKKLRFKEIEKPDLIPSKPQPKKPFTDIILPVQGNKITTKKFIQQQLSDAGIPFELMLSKPIPKTSTNKNPDGFNGAVAAMITVFKDIGYFKPDLTFLEILDAYLEESGNTIGKLASYKRNYFHDNYYLQYKTALEELKIKK